MRLGIFLGFLIGAAIAAVLSKSDTAEAPGLQPDEAPDSEEVEAAAKGLVDKIRRQAREAVAAAKEASEAKERELLRDFERTTHRR